MAKPVNFSSLSPRAQAFFTERSAKRKAAARSKKSKGKRGGSGGGS